MMIEFTSFVSIQHAHTIKQTNQQTHILSIKIPTKKSGQSTDWPTDQKDKRLNYTFLYTHTSFTFEISFFSVIVSMFLLIE